MCREVLSLAAFSVVFVSDGCIIIIVCYVYKIPIDFGDRFKFQFYHLINGDLDHHQHKILIMLLKLVPLCIQITSQP